MPPTLIGLAFTDGHRSKRLPHFDYLDLTEPVHALMNWRIVVQGSQVIFVSPPGWKPSTRGNDPNRDKTAPSVLVQISRAHLELYWSGTIEEIGALDKAQWPATKTEPQKEKR